jgi:hypothetical protein
MASPYSRTVVKREIGGKLLPTLPTNAPADDDFGSGQGAVEPKTDIHPEELPF